MSDTEQSPVTRDDLAVVLRRVLLDRDGPASDGRVTEGDDMPWPYADNWMDVIHIDGSVELPQLADAILDEFTLTRKFEPAEVDPWVDPEPWVYVVTGKRAVHPLPQTYYRYAPRTHLDYDVAQRVAGK